MVAQEEAQNSGKKGSPGAVASRMSEVGVLKRRSVGECVGEVGVDLIYFLLFLHNSTACQA